MKGDKLNRRIFIKDILCAITMMDIKIDNQNAFYFVILLCISRRDRDVIEETKTHGPIDFGVMSRRPDQRQSTLASLPIASRKFMAKASGPATTEALPCWADVSG